MKTREVFAARGWREFSTTLWVGGPRQAPILLRNEANVSGCLMLWIVLIDNELTNDVRQFVTWLRFHFWRLFGLFASPLGRVRARNEANMRRGAGTTRCHRGGNCDGEYNVFASLHQGGIPNELNWLPSDAFVSDVRGCGRWRVRRAHSINDLDSRLLLGEAMEGAEAPDEVGAVDTDDAAVGEEGL